MRSRDRTPPEVVRRLRSRAPATAPSGYELIKHPAGHAQLVGYARVSTRDQNLSVQLDELERAGCCRVYAEKCSSVGLRLGWAGLLGDVRKGDTVVVVRLDRIGRKLGEVVNSLDVLSAEGVYVRSIAQQLDTRSSSGRQLVGLFAWLAETERELLRERTMAGLEAARKRGRSLGRPSVLTKANIEMCSLLRAKGHSLRRIADAVHLGEGTVRKALELAANAQSVESGRQLQLEGA